MKKLITGISILFALSAWVLVNWPALISLHLRWMKFDEAYAIGYPVCAIALWLIIERSKVLRGIGIAPSILAALLFILVTMISRAALLVQFQLLQQLTVPISLWLIVVAVFGWRIGRSLYFPFALIYLAIPLWDALTLFLRGSTVMVTQHALNVLRVPAYVAGYEITLPAGKILVKDSCSGLNVFLAAAVIGLLQFHLMTQRLWRRAAVVALAVIIGVLDNWVRVIVIVLVAHVSDMQSPLVNHHGNFGWLVFVVSLIPFFIGVRWLERGLPVVKTATAGIVGSAVPYGRMAAYGMSCALGGLILLAATVGLEQREMQAIALPPPPLAKAAEPSWLPHYVGYDQQQAWRIDIDSRRYEILVLTYLHQTNDKKLIYYDNSIADEYHSKSLRRLMVGNQSINEAVIGRDGARIVWWFYLIDGRVVNSGLAAKFYQLTGYLHGDPRASLVTISTPCADADCRDLAWSEQSIAVTSLLQNLFAAWAPKI